MAEDTIISDTQVTIVESPRADKVKTFPSPDYPHLPEDTVPLSPKIPHTHDKYDDRLKNPGKKFPLPEPTEEPSNN